MDQNGVVKVLEALGASKIKVSGGKVQCSCPFAKWRHSNGTDRSPSFSMDVNPSGPSRFFCFSCKAAGKKAISLLYAWKDATGTWRSDLHDFIREQEGGSLRERLGKLNSYRDQRRHSQNPNTQTHWRVDGYERQFDADDYKHMLKSIPSYAIKRGITRAQAKRWKIGFDEEHQRMFITISDEHGKMVGYSGRALHDDQEPKYMHAKDMAKEKYLFGEQFVDKRCRLGLLMEGFMDVWAMERAGWRNALGTMGTQPSRPHILKLKKWFDCVIIFPHNDAKPPVLEDGTSKLPPGLQMAQDYKDALVLEGVRAYIAPFISGRKDPGDWVPEDHAAMRQRLKKVLDEFEPEASGEEGSSRGEEGATAGPF